MKTESAKREAGKPVNGVAVVQQDTENPWLRLRADVDFTRRRFRHYEVIFKSLTMEMVDRQGKTIMTFHKNNMIDVSVREAFGGASFFIITGDGEIEAARFSFPYIEPYRQAVPTIRNWLAEKEETGVLALPVLEESSENDRCSKCYKTSSSSTSKCLTCSSRWSMLSRLAAYCTPYRSPMLVCALLLVLSVFIEVIPPYLIKMIVDEVAKPSGSLNVLFALASGLALVQVLSAAMQVIRSYLGVRIGGKLIGAIRRDMFGALLKLSMRFFDYRQVSQFIGRIQDDTDELKEFLTNGMVYLVTQMLLGVGILFMLFHLNWQLAAMILIPTPFLFAGFYWLWNRLSSLWYSQWQSAMHVNNVIGEALQGIRVIKAFAQENAEKNRFEKVNNHWINRTISFGNLWLGVTPIFTVLTAVFGIAIWYLGGRSVMSGTMSIGTLTAFTTYLLMFFGPIQASGQLLSWLNRSLGSAERILEIIDAKVDVPDKRDAVELSSVSGEIRFHDVRYGYEVERPVLKDINLTIRPGEMIGLVGRSGAGKTTLINMICRFYDPNAGSIALDGHDLKDIRQESLRKHIGVVLQETFLFDGTIAENIAYGRPDNPPETIIAAAHAANAHDFICRLPEGYDTRVGERGHRLSGGEKQRIAIARALLLDPEILILDEATASVDTETERLIQEALSRLIRGRTTIAIAHRLSTLRHADRLVVLDQGRIVEMGTHDELYAKQTHYYHLVESQKQTAKTPSEVG
ncbi:ABC transporter ATP-binding protein [Paenibacillus sinopodophylli]|uniref:ABC transporter ATP-binding protein n=1 Tax=Paenibacillus sinopodophylli TaxID=1837342 RepID=UPI001FE916DA|nr:ABC transporter ATP-binding protein [Paenibacillus sinopodophylli]